MENIKENLDVQRYEMNDILSALMGLQDGKTKKVLTNHFRPVVFVEMFNDKEKFDEMIWTLEGHLEFYELALRGCRELADMLQVPKNFEG